MSFPSVRKGWLVGAVILAWGCQAATLRPPQVNPQQAALMAMAQCDVDQNGWLDAEELRRAPGLQAALASADADHDGRLQTDEIARRIAAIVGQNVGLLQFACLVTMDDQPLAGATVTANPESFLGPQFKSASGTTDNSGRAQLSMGLPDLPPGMQCGLYRVEISQKDALGNEQIPSRYNHNTVLGLEVASDVPTLERGLVFALRSGQERE